MDCDGILDTDDDDIDGDGVVGFEDCDDLNNISTIITEDMDCDGVVNEEDNDADGDGIIGLEDCNDLDNTSTIIEDMDCDGIVNTDDEDVDGDGIDSVMKMEANLTVMIATILWVQY